ncbi:MAG: M42 family metallopeptidase [Oscillospiraceae bacterium]
MNIRSTLRDLTGETGVSGCENGAAQLALALLREYAPDAEIDRCGNVIGYITSGRTGAKTLMLDAHIDQIGMIVTDIDSDGFIKVGFCGGADMRVLLAQSVIIHGEKAVMGVVSTMPPHVSSDHSKVPEVGDISIDVGMPQEQAKKLIRLGDRVTISSDFRELCGDVISAPSVDDRSGVCAILAALDMLKGRALKYDLAVCFSAQEETGERGVKGAAFRLEPDEAVAVDVSFGRTPDSVPHETAELGSGVMIGVSAVLDRGMTERLHETAKRCGIPHTTEVMPSSTGTNADSVAVSRGGVKCCTLSIPIRYMHTPIETVSISDIESTARLICEYAVGGDENE